jgi:hypothetical protein
MFTMENIRTDKYGLDRKAKFVPTLYTKSSLSKYCEWEDAILDFYYSGELPSNQLVNLAKRTFSNHLWQWWKESQQGLINHGNEPCTSWQDMRTMLEGKYEPAIEDFFHPKKIVAKGGDNPFGTKQNVHSSWTDSIVGVEPLHSHIVERSLPLALKIFLGMNTFSLLFLEVLKNARKLLLLGQKSQKFQLLAVQQGVVMLWAMSFIRWSINKLLCPSVIQRIRLLLVTKIF